jgi:hypothetical protein
VSGISVKIKLKSDSPFGTVVTKRDTTFAILLTMVVSDGNSRSLLQIRLVRLEIVRRLIVAIQLYRDFSGNRGCF